MEEQKEEIPPRPEQWALSGWWLDMMDYGGDDISNAFMMLAALALSPFGMIGYFFDLIAWPLIKAEQIIWDIKHKKKQKGEDENGQTKNDIK